MPLSQLDSRLKCPRCGSRRLVVQFSAPDPNEAYEIVPAKLGVHFRGDGWWDVLRNGEPVWLCSTRKAAERYVADPAYRASLVTKMLHER